MHSAPRIDVGTDADAVAQHVADWLIERMNASTAPFALNLSGGSTPKRLYGLLAALPYRNRVPWTRLHLFFGDERFVPPDDPESNYRMVHETMLAHVPIPPEQVHPIPTVGLSPAGAAATYEHTLKSFYGAQALDPSRPLFDLTLLGLGPDGHTASLFPGTAALDEKVAWVVPVTGPTPPRQRITLTYPTLASSRAVAFLVTGIEKRPILARVRQGDPALPASHIRSAGDIWWFLDRAAAGV